MQAAHYDSQRENRKLFHSCTTLTFHSKLNEVVIVPWTIKPEQKEKYEVHLTFGFQLQYIQQMLF